MVGLPEIITSQSNIFLFFFFFQFWLFFPQFPIAEFGRKLNQKSNNRTGQIGIIQTGQEGAAPVIDIFIGWFLRREINLHRWFLAPAGDSRHRLVEAPRQIQLLFIFRRSKAKVLQIQKMITTIVGWLQKHKIYQINLDFLSLPFHLQIPQN